MKYNILCPGGGKECRGRYFDPKGSHDGYIDIKRCPPCDDGIGDPERRYDRERYGRNRRADEARREKWKARR